MSEYTNPYENLDAWKLTRRARILAYRFTQSLPPGWAKEAQQINSAAASAVRNTAEGAGRFKPLEKIQKFEYAAGEASEAAAAVQSLLDLDLGEGATGREVVGLQARAGAVLTGLIRYQRRRLE